VKQRKVMGEVLHEEGKYLLAYEDRKYELKVGELVDEPALKRAIGQSAEVVLAESVVAVRVPEIHCVLCYIPVDYFAVIEAIGDRVRQGMLQGFLDEGLISQQIYDEQMRTM